MIYIFPSSTQQNQDITEETVLVFPVMICNNRRMDGLLSCPGGPAEQGGRGGGGGGDDTTR